MVVLDATIANIALPYIQADLDFSEHALPWIITAYSLTFGGFLLLGGRCGDLFGRRRAFIFGLVLFAVASLVGGFAQNEAMLLGSRAAQGLGAAFASPNALALITTTFEPGPKRSRAFAVYAMMSGLGAAVGLLLGGWLTGMDPTMLRRRRRGVAAHLPHQRADRRRSRRSPAPMLLGESDRHCRPARRPRRGHRHRPGCSRWSTASPAPATAPTAGATPWTVTALVVGVVAARRLRAPRAAQSASPLLPGRILAEPGPDGGLRRDDADPRGDVRDVLLPHPDPAERHGRVAR